MTDSARRPTAPDGVVVVDKPAGWTSHDVVSRMRRLAGTRKVGHAGTLDPMATGVLVVGIGRATRLLTWITGADKEYLATVRLGESTTTDDAQGEPTGGAPADALDLDDVCAAVADLTGDLAQVPSAVSAVKVDGQRAYRRVRAGEQVELAARPVRVEAFELLAVRRQPPHLDLDVRVVVSSGTYVRALARDLGSALLADGLPVGGHLTALRRTRVGRFDLAGARTLDQLAAADPSLPLTVLDLAAAAGAVLPVRDLTVDEARELSFGRRIAPSSAPGPTAGLGPDGRLVAIVENRSGLAAPVLVTAPAAG